jgi:DNA polymerase III delta prime subunit
VRVFLSFLERALTSILLSFFLMLISFSFLTGKFPPSKTDLSKAIQLMMGMYTSSLDTQKAQSDLQAAQGMDDQTMMTQMIAFQRASLKRTEITQELMALFPKFQVGQASPEVQEALIRIEENLQQIESDLQVVTSHYSRMQEEGGSPQQEESGL